MQLTLKILDCFLCLTNIILLKKFLHLYQLKDYSNARYLSHNFKRNYYILIANFLAFILINIIKTNAIKIILFCILIIFNIIIYFKILASKKTKFVITNKIIRLYLISSILLISSIFFEKIFCFSQILMVFTPILSNFLNVYDKIKNFYYIKSAQKKLKTYKTKIIAITGSNGKTSVKNILLKILSTQYNVMATPLSYNTPLGISKFINNNLNSECKFLILEYGARHKKDIKKLCKIFGADYGIITTISPQHLQTFKTIENIANTKNELAKFLKNKLCVFNIDNKFCLEMFNNKEGEKLAISIKGSANLYAQNIAIKNYKTEFTIITKNLSLNLSTNLLGEHNITNILLASALSIKLKISKQNLIKAIKILTPTPHRLEHIQSAMHILDDSYNCSIDSATESIKVLSITEFKKMVITPGIIEGGKHQYQLNFELGKLCPNLDYVIIVGETNKKAILSGIKSQNYKCKILLCKSLDECKKYFKLLGKNDCLLFLNDLPDDYN